jgi:hypothetical protein
MAEVPRVVVQDYPAVIEILRMLRTEKHAYQTVVIDTADWLETLIKRWLCQRDRKESIEDYGYGKGPNLVEEQMRLVLAQLDALARGGLHVIVLAHCHIKTYRNPLGDDYDKYEMKLLRPVAGVLREWPQALLFVHREVYVKKERKQAGKGKVCGGAERIVETEGCAAWDAKNHYSLPRTLPLLFCEFDFHARQGSQPKRLAEPEKIQGLLEAWTRAAWPDAQAQQRALAFLGCKSLAADALAEVPAEKIERLLTRLLPLLPTESPLTSEGLAHA